MYLNFLQLLCAALPMLLVAAANAAFIQDSGFASLQLTIDDLSYNVQIESDIEFKANLSKVHFYLHTNQNPEVADELFVGDVEALQNSHFHANGQLWILIHGFSANIEDVFPYETKEDLLATEPRGNVIVIDWSKLAAGPNYVRAVRNAYAVSNHSAELLQFLLQQRVVKAAQVHLIGFSLGGQVVGITGKRFQWLTNENVGRVTGLDPAWPGFADTEDDDRISSDDATFVDIIHTNGGTQGIIQPKGHVDHYPNGGMRQPGCGIDITGACAHQRAVQYFMESIHGTTPFVSCKCVDWQEFDSGNCGCTETSLLGHHVDQSSRGEFYLKTNGEEPFALG